MLNNERLKREEVDIWENCFFNKSYDHVKAIEKLKNFKLKVCFYSNPSIPNGVLGFPTQ